MWGRRRAPKEGVVQWPIKILRLEDENPEKPGTVCSYCGRTVREREYSSGESTCCHVEVTAEEFYGKEQQ